MQRDKTSFSSQKAQLYALVLAGGVIGGVAGFVSQSTLFPPEAVAILKYAKAPLPNARLLDDLTALVEDEPVEVLLDKVVMPQFAQAAGAAAKLPGLANAIVARQYGGEGRLSARANSEGNQIELRFRAGSEADARDGIAAINDEIIKEASARFDKARELAKLNISNLKAAIAQNQQWLDTVSAELAAAGTAKDQTTTMILIRLLLESKMSEYPIALNKLEYRLADIQKPPLTVVSVAMAKGLLASPLSAAILAALAGMGIAGLLLPFLAGAPKNNKGAEPDLKS